MALAPSPLPTWVRRALYAATSWLNRHPEVVRFFGGFFRRWPSLGKVVPALARHDAVTRALQRPFDLSNTSHRPNLVAGDFLIGMPHGRRYEWDRRMFRGMLPGPELVRRASAMAARRRAAQCAERLGRGDSFDLVEDYLMWVVLAGVEACLEPARKGIIGHRAPEHEDRARLDYMLELRHVAAQLVGGADAPPEVAARAHASAVSLQARVRAMRALVRATASYAGQSPDPDSLVRNGVGMAWVSHPVTVQSGALVMRELLARPDHLAHVRERVQALGERAWRDPALRRWLHALIAECMRHRPVFALLARNVPRDTDVEASPQVCPHVAAGQSLLLLTHPALWDPARVKAPSAFDPSRYEGCSLPDDLMLMFGHGPRACPGRDIALDVLASALIGLAQLPPLRYARWPGFGRIVYDGPMIRHLPLRAS